MAVYMITYDLNSKGQNYEDVIQSIKDASTGAWCSYWKSSYRLIVIETKANYQGWLSEKQWKYIRENIFG